MSTALVPPAPLAHHRIDLAPERDGRAWREWGAHVEAGRIGPALGDPPPPAPGEARPRGDYRFASLAAILGPRRVSVW